VSRPEIKSFFRFFFLFPLILLTQCSTAQVLGTSQEEAVELLKRGDTGFIRQADLPPDFSQARAKLQELNRIHPAAAFYSGLLLAESPQSEQGNRSLVLLLFSAALDSSSFPASREAALKLIPLVLDAEEDRDARNILGVLDSGNLRRRQEPHLAALRLACLYRLGRYNDLPKDFSTVNPAIQGHAAEWGKALTLLAAWKTSPGEILKREISDFLFTIPGAEVLRWASREVHSMEGLLSTEENMVLSARLLSGNYRVMLLNLLPALHEGGSIFFRYPNLIAYLGRAYQFTPAMRQEGLRLFESWIGLLDAGQPPDSGEPQLAKYMALFYAGRIERALGNHGKSSEYFNRALSYAPDAVQSDACIWYLLMNALAVSPAAALPLALNTMPQWSELSSFSGILDRLSSYLTRQRQWNALLEIFHSLENKGPNAPLAQFAWITGRALQEGYIEPGRLRAGLNTESLFRITFETERASFYYRAMAAARLGETITLEKESPEPRRRTRANTAGDEAEFILGFFECGASSFVMPYLRVMEEELSLPELRKIAAAFASSGRWQDSLRLVTRYTRRRDYVFNIQDLFLAHPRPYLELVEHYSREMEIGPELLYGLIRTESHFMSAIASHAGAVGLAQLMPATAADMAGRLTRRGGPDYRGPDGIDLTDPETNIHLGAFYLRHLMNQTENPMLALLAYNGGQGRLRRWLAADRQLGALPPDLFLETIEFTETREYGRLVSAAAAVYGYLYYGLNMEELVWNLYW
jgi:soluble lytic murein transglycosylase